MFNYLIWSYRDDNNCWDYVRACLNQLYGVPLDYLPKFGAVLDEGREITEGMTKLKMEAMTHGQRFIIPLCTPCGPIDGAIACKYYDDYLYHVGIVIGDKVCHVRKSRTGVRQDTIKHFETGARTEYYAHNYLR